MLPPVRRQSRSPRRSSETRVAASSPEISTDLASGFPVSWSKDNPAWQNVAVKNWYTVPSKDGVTKISLGSVEFMPNSLQGPAPSSAVTLVSSHPDGGKGGTDGGKGGKQTGPSDADGGAGKGGKHTGTSQAPPAPQTTASTATAANDSRDFWVKSYLTVPTSLVPKRVTWGELEHLPVQPAAASDSRTS